MHVPKRYRVNDRAALLAFMQTHGFATVVSGGGMPIATHIPLQVVVSGENILLEGHLSMANEQLKLFRDQPEVLAIFTGPHSYVSSSWYAKANVPTWNYQAVHAQGKVRIQSEKELHASLVHLVDRYEAESAEPMSVEGLPKDYLAGQIRGIAGIEIEVTHLEGAFKLSQNRTDEDYAEIMHQLEQRGDAGSKAVAEAMRKWSPHKTE